MGIVPVAVSLVLLAHVFNTFIKHLLNARQYGSRTAINKIDPVPVFRLADQRERQT